MADKKPSIQEYGYIAIIKEAMQGGMDRAGIVAKFGKEWQKGKRTVDRYIAAAKDLLEADAREKEELLKKAQGSVLEALKDQIATEDELDVILTQIARGTLEAEEESVVWDGEQSKFVKIKKRVLPSHRDRTSAIQELFKRKGSYAPTKGKMQIELDGVDEYEVIGESDDNKAGDKTTKEPD